MTLPAPQGVTPACRCGCHRYGTTTACADCPDRHSPALDLAERLENNARLSSFQRTNVDKDLLFQAAALLRDQSATIEALRGENERFRQTITDRIDRLTVGMLPGRRKEYRDAAIADALASPTDQEKARE